MSIPDSNGVIHTAYQNPPPAHGANLQVFDSEAEGTPGGGCVALTFNQQGPKGEKGDTGSQGSQGEPGLSGSTLYYSEVAGPLTMTGSYDFQDLVGGPAVTFDYVVNSLVRMYAVYLYSNVVGFIVNERVWASDQNGQLLTDVSSGSSSLAGGGETIVLSEPGTKVISLNMRKRFRID